MTACGSPVLPTTGSGSHNMATNTRTLRHTCDSPESSLRRCAPTTRHAARRALWTRLARSHGSGRNGDESRIGTASEDGAGFDAAAADAVDDVEAFVDR